MAKKHTFEYVKSTSNGVERRKETRELTRSQAIKFNCLDCYGGYTAEVRDCVIKTCPLWVFRPYQKSNSLPIDDSQQTDMETKSFGNG